MASARPTHPLSGTFRDGRKVSFGPLTMDAKLVTSEAKAGALYRAARAPKSRLLASAGGKGRVQLLSKATKATACPPCLAGHRSGAGAPRRERHALGLEAEPRRWLGPVRHWLTRARSDPGGGEVGGVGDEGLGAHVLPRDTASCNTKRALKRARGLSLRARGVCHVPDSHTHGMATSLFFKDVPGQYESYILAGLGFIRSQRKKSSLAARTPPKV